jgi:hypothetical protein
MKTTVIGNVTFDMFDNSHQEWNANIPKFFDALKCEMVSFYWFKAWSEMLQCSFFKNISKSCAKALTLKVA